MYIASAKLTGAKRPGLFDMALKNLGFLKNLKSPNLGFLGFLENKNLMSDLSFLSFFHLLCN